MTLVQSSQWKHWSVSWLCCLCLDVFLDFTDIWGLKSSSERENPVNKRRWQSYALSSAMLGKGRETVCMCCVYVCVALSVWVDGRWKDSGREGPDEGIISQHTVQTIVPIALPLTITFGLRVNCSGKCVYACVCVCVCVCVLGNCYVSQTHIH